MIERVLLLCAGRAQRWGNHRGVPKHLVTVDGEPLLDRTIRLVRENTRAPIVIVSFDPRYDRRGCERFEPVHGPVDFCDTDKFLSSRERWAPEGQTVMLFGDVFFTEMAAYTIFCHTGEHRWFGRREGSYYSGCPWRELFALSFPAREIPRLVDGMLAVKAKLLAGKIPRGGGWEVYDELHLPTCGSFVTIDDFTEDFDFPADFERWLRRYHNPVHRLLVPVYGPMIKGWKWRLARWKKALASRRNKIDPVTSAPA